MNKIICLLFVFFAATSAQAKTTGQLHQDCTSEDKTLKGALDQLGCVAYLSGAFDGMAISGLAVPKSLQYSDLNSQTPEICIIDGLNHNMIMDIIKGCLGTKDPEAAAISGTYECLLDKFPCK